MAKKYYKFNSGDWKKTLPRETEKAIFVTYAGGHTNINDSFKILPKSQIICSEPNNFGNFDMFIPKWLFTFNQIDPMRIREFEYQGEVDI